MYIVYSILYLVSCIKENEQKIKSFTDLYAWQKGHELVLITYKITKKFPKDELFGLISQMRRAAVSITSNIAEGFSRKSNKNKCQFYSMAQGSVTELQSQSLIARDIGYLDNIKFKELAEQAVKVHKLLSGLIKSSKKVILNS